VIDAEPPGAPRQQAFTGTDPSPGSGTEARLHHRLRQQEILAELGARALRGGDRDTLLQEAARLVALGMGTRFAKIMEYLPEEDQLLVRAGVGWRDGIVGQYRTGADLTSPSGHALRTDEPVISNHLTAESRFRTPQVLMEHGIRRAINVVIRTDDAAWGVLEADSPNPEDFEREDLAFMRAVANLLGVAIGRMQVEASLTASLTRTSDILESISDAFYAVDREWRFTYVNRKAEALWGRKREDLVGKVYWEEFPQAVGSEAYDAHLRAAREQRMVQVELVSPILKHWVDVSIYPSEHGLSVYFFDITLRKRTEEARRLSEERYRLAVRATNDAIWDWDLRHNRIEWNEAFQESYGHRPEDVNPAGEWWIGHVHPEDRDRVSRSIHAVIDGAANRWSDEYRFQRADGSYADVLDRGFMVRGEGGQPLRMIGAMLDVSERRRSERELRQLNEHLEAEVSRRAEQMRLQAEALRQSQKLEAVGQLTGGVAHDFNNLLTIISSSADLLRRPDLPEERRQLYVDAISDTAGRASKLTGQLLAFARRQPLQPEVFIVGERVQAVSDLIHPLVGAGIAIEVAIECEGCAVEADPSQFETALVNLAVNARDAMEGEGRMTLRTKLASEVPPVRGHAGSQGEFVAVSVSDTGTGIRPELLDRIFEPFFTTKEIGKGTGLGLSQVYGFAKQSGGELVVESEVGRGTSFTLYLPKAVTRPEAVPVGSADHAAGAEVGQIRVLLVEDNTQVGDFAWHLLQDLGYPATWVTSAQAALDLLAEGASRFDVVFSDIVMPGMNGLDLGEEIRRRWPGLRVILTSGYSHVLAAEGTRGFDLLHKPYSVERLSKALRAGR
jgi:PAS domain S-box-containing protein